MAEFCFYKSHAGWIRQKVHFLEEVWRSGLRSKTVYKQTRHYEYSPARHCLQKKWQHLSTIPENTARREGFDCIFPILAASPLHNIRKWKQKREKKRQKQKQKWGIEKKIKKTPKRKSRKPSQESKVKTTHVAWLKRELKMAQESPDSFPKTRVKKGVKTCKDE